MNEVYETPALTVRIVKQFKLGTLSPHGPAHWMRVKKNGLVLARDTGASTKIIHLFAIFHDSCRWDDTTDPEHGLRGADLVIRYRKKGYFECTNHELDILVAACEGHTGGSETESITIATCWDADRLDLPRVGIEVNPKYLLTEAAKQSFNIEEARNRAMDWVYKQMDLVHDNWELGRVRRV